MRKAAVYILNMMFVFSLFGCGEKMNMTETEESETTIESSMPDEVVEDDVEEDVVEENSVDILQKPSKDEVLAMREKVLEGMSQEEIGRLNENIKVANLVMEGAYLNDYIFDRLSDKDSVYWQYFDQKGEIQLGWLYNYHIYSMDVIMRAEGISEEEFYERNYEPGTVYNRFDAENFIDLIEDMMNSVHDENLSADLQQLIDLTDLAAATHDMQYASEIYKILHDLDYFLLRYGIEDVGKYMQNTSTVAKYYGVLNVYGGKPFKPENKYYIVEYQNVDHDETVYGNIRREHEEFRDQDGSSYFYYDMDCFYFNETYPAILNETLQTYYDLKKESYHHDSETYAGGSSEESNKPPYDSLILDHVTYAGNDYVSLLFNDVSYMGGAHPYSAFEGITIDCSTGEIVPVNRFLDDSDEDIGEQIRAVSGIDVYDPREWDYYITARSVVFFYYDPGFGDLTATKRLR